MSDVTTEVVEENVVPIQESQEPPATETIELSKYKEMQGDMHKYKDRNRAAELEVAELKAQVEAHAVKEQENNQEYKSLYEQEKKKTAEAVENLGKEKFRVQDEKKFNAIWKAAKSKGIEDDAFEELYNSPREEVFIEEDDRGVRRVVGAEQYIEGLFEKKRYMFKKGAAPNVNTQFPDGVIQKPKQLSAQEILNLEKTDKPAYLKEMQKLRAR